MTRIEAYRYMLEGGIIVHPFMGDRPICLAKDRHIREDYTGFGVNNAFMYDVHLADGWEPYEGTSKER